jgi:hypothetical protein
MTIPGCAARASTKMTASVHGGSAGASLPVPTGRAGGLRDEGATRIHGRGIDLSERAPVSLGCRFVVSSSCCARRARSGIQSAPVLEAPPRSGSPDGQWPDASAASVTCGLWHAFLCAALVVLRQRVLRIRYILLCQQRLLFKWP